MNKEQLGKLAKKQKRLVKDDYILAQCSGKSVLDVGCIGQDRDVDSPDWLHNKVRKVATHLDGVDILEEPVKKLRARGYSVYTVQELEGVNKKYGVVLMSDVIEHVNNPVDFLKSYSKFLATDGIIVVSTPNSNRANNFVNVLFNNTYSVNPEHVFWFCPRTMGEVVERAGLEVKEFYWARQYYGIKGIKGLYQRFKFLLTELLIRLRSNFSPNMIFAICLRK